MNNKKKPVGVAANDSSTSGNNETYFQNSFITCWSPYWSDSFLSAEVTIKLTSRKLSDVIGWESWAKFIKKLHNVNIMSHVKVITLSRKWVHHIAWMNYHTSDYIIACIDTFNTVVTHYVSQVITLSHTLLHSTQKWQHYVTQVTISWHTLIHSIQKWLHSTQRW